MHFKLQNMLSLPTEKVEFKGNMDVLSGQVNAVSIDTRTLERGDLYVALKGENHDGHEFVPKAFEKGAIACVVETSYWHTNHESLAGKSIFVVEDSLTSLQQLANQQRRKLSAPLIGLTGTNGKTTTKEMVAAVLSQIGNAGKTHGNFNNHIGVPLTLLALQSDDRFAVIEMGTNHFGEIRDLCCIAEPEYGLITNIGHGHTEHLQDVRGVTRAKMELFDYLQPKGHIFANMDDPNIAKHKTYYAYKCTYAFDTPAILQAQRVNINANGQPAFRVNGIVIRLNLAGTHNLSNALASVAVGLEFGVSLPQIKEALEHVSLPGKRMELLKIHGITILNDAYNANPESTLAALETVKNMAISGHKWLALGDMLELGEKADAKHAEIGSILGDYGITALFTYGPLSRSASEAATVKARHFEDKQMMSSALREELSAGDLLLVKGSRGMQMEDIITYLKGASQ